MLAKVSDLVQALKMGKPVILLDDEERENEGDIIFPAEFASPELTAFTIRYTGGVVCLALAPELADELELPPMTQNNNAPRGTAFTVSIDAARGISTGISAADRALTLRTAALSSQPADFVRPGHVFPLRAKAGGVLERPGHTEAAVELMKLAGLRPAAAISELMHDSGEMMRLPEILEFAAAYGILVGTIAELIRYRLEQGERTVVHQAEASLPTPYARFRIVGYHDQGGAEHAALVLGDLKAEPPLVRLHSECLTGDVFHSLRCDCGTQRDLALRKIAEAGSGVFIYLREHEGRGIGLVNKIRAYRLQEEGLDTVEANLALGFPPDARDYSGAAQILYDLEVRRVRLLTNNPHKVRSLEALGIEVVERVALIEGETKENSAYLQTKREKMGHLGS